MLRFLETLESAELTRAVERALAMGDGRRRRHPAILEHGGNSPRTGSAWMAGRICKVEIPTAAPGGLCHLAAGGAR